MENKPDRDIIDIVLSNIIPFLILVIGSVLDIMLLNVALHSISAASDSIVLFGFALLTFAIYIAIQLFHYGKMVITGYLK